MEKKILEIKLHLDEDQLNLILGLLTDPFDEYPGSSDKGLKAAIKDKKFLEIRDEDWET